jgi:hypothetical protein
MISSVTGEPMIRAILLYIVGPGGTKSGVAVRTGKVAGTIKTDFERFKINIPVWRTRERPVEILNLVDAALIHTIADVVATDILDLPAIFASVWPQASLHQPTFLLLLWCVMYELGVLVESL